MIAPILDEIAEEYQGKLTVAKLNIDQNPGTAPKYGIRGIPTLLLFKNGEVAATKVGALSKGQLKEFLDANWRKQLLFRRPDSYFCGTLDARLESC